MKIRLLHWVHEHILMYKTYIVSMYRFKCIALLLRITFWIYVYIIKVNGWFLLNFILEHTNGKFVLNDAGSIQLILKLYL